MARGGLSLDECHEILAAWRDMHFQIDDDVLKKLAMDFQLVAPSDIDPNEISDLLALPGNTVVVSSKINGSVSLENTLLELWQDASIKRPLATNIQGVLLSVTLSPKMLSQQWGRPLTRIREIVRSKVPLEALVLNPFYEDDALDSANMMLVIRTPQNTHAKNVSLARKNIQT